MIKIENDEDNEPGTERRKEARDAITTPQPAASREFAVARCQL